MRLDHLLSKEKEEVGVALLSSCQGVHAMDFGRKHEVCLQNGMLHDEIQHKANGRARDDAKHYREWTFGMDDEKATKIPVAYAQSASPLEKHTI